MANRIIWSPRAASHLESICEFIAEDSPAYARIFARKKNGYAEVYLKRQSSIDVEKAFIRI